MSEMLKFRQSSQQNVLGPPSQGLLTYREHFAYHFEHKAQITAIVAYEDCFMTGDLLGVCK